MLKTLIKNLSATSTCSDGACNTPSMSKALSHKKCLSTAEQACQLLCEFDKQQKMERKESLKCPEVVKHQLRLVTSLEEKGFYVNAVLEINKALCSAPNDTESIGLLYATRSNILEKMTLYAEALESNKLALDSILSPCKRGEAENAQRELSRKVCAGGKKEHHNFRVALSYPACPSNPFVIKDIRVEEDCQYGRYLKTERDLEVGDVICIEQPYVKTIQPEQIYTRCTHCLEEAPHLLVPCTGCTNAMFCSRKCLESAWDSFHQFECSISAELMTLDQDVSRLAMRTFLVVVRLFNNEIAQLRHFVTENKCRKLSPFELDQSRLCKQEQFLAFYNGNCVDTHMSECVRAANRTESARLASLLSRKCVFARQLECDQLKVFLMELFYHLNCVNTNNSYEVGGPSLVHDKVPTCIGLFLCMSMASHSCAANVARLRVDGVSQMWVVTRPIPCQSQIFDNYGAFFVNQPREERQLRLQEHFGFKCTCIACCNDYPLAKDMCAPVEVPWPGLSYLSGTGPVTVAKLKAELLAVKKFITRYDCHFPCAQLREAELRLIHLFRAAAKDETWETKYPEFTNHDSSDGVLCAEECEAEDLLGLLD